MFIFLSKTPPLAQAPPPSASPQPPPHDRCLKREIILHSELKLLHLLMMALIIVVE